MEKPTILKYDFYFTNVVTEIFSRADNFCESSAQRVNKYPFKIHYGNFRAKFYIKKTDKVLDFTTFLSIPWLHTGFYKNFFTNESIPNQGICLGIDTKKQISDILNRNYSEEKEKKLIKIILKDYFSTGIWDHWYGLHVPRGIEEITKDDLFICKLSQRTMHKNAMSKYIYNVRNLFDYQRVYFIGADKRKSIIRISDYRRCLNCGNYTFKTSKIKCEGCNTNG